jgi:hypothetical protein
MIAAAGAWLSAMPTPAWDVRTKLAPRAEQASCPRAPTQSTRWTIRVAPLMLTVRAAYRADCALPLFAAQLWLARTLAMTIAFAPGASA